MTKKLTDDLHCLTQKLISCKQDIGKYIFEIGGILHIIKQYNLWDDQFESYNAYLASPELSFSRSWAEKARKLFEVYADRLKILEKVIDIDSDKLYYISGVVDKDVDMWIEKARTLSRSDLRYELSQFNGLPKPDPSKNITDIIKEFLYDYLPRRKKRKAEDFELEELLLEFFKFIK